MQLSGHYFRPHLHILNFLQNFLISFGADESNLGIQGCQITIIISFLLRIKSHFSINFDDFRFNAILTWGCFIVVHY